MALQRTFAMIKPDAYRDGNVGKILALIEQNGFTLIHARLMKFTEKSARLFYEVHDGKPFFQGLVDFTCLDKVMALVLEKENAIADFRMLVGDTDPSKAEKASIRGQFGKGLPNNAIHGSDSESSAKKEITYIFGEFAAVPSSEKAAAKEY